MKVFKNLAIWNLTIWVAICSFFLAGCEDYLNIPPEADISEEEIFGTYETFQGFQDRLAVYLADYNRHGERRCHSIGGEAIAPAANQAVNAGNIGDYWRLMRELSIYVEANKGNQLRGGLYSYMWEALRIANISLEKLESGVLTKATADERKWLKGQALFYRAYYHYEFVRAFGTIPYVDTVLSAEEQNMHRHWSYEKDGKTYNDVQAVLERAVEDFDAAARLLPDVWPSPNVNYGRPTSLAALGFKAKALLFSASPLFNEQATGTLAYDKALLERCAEASQATIDLAKSLIGTQPAGMPAVNANGLTNWEDMRQMYCTFSGRVQPGTPEVLFKKPTNVYGAASIRQSVARVYGTRNLTNQIGSQASQMYVDKFEMTDGSRYRIEYDKDPDKRWENRDKRFTLNFYTHGDKAGNITINLADAKLNSEQNVYIIRKYFPDGANKNNVGTTAYATPLLRLADIYLTYAEAVYEGTGSYSTVPTGLKMSAAEAVDIVRLRAGQPDVAATLPSYDRPLPDCEEVASDEPFRLLYRNERAVEFAYEGVYWFDIRRWKRAHLKDGKPLQALSFQLVGNQNNISNPVDNENVTRVTRVNFVFKDAHYWLPFLTSLTRFTADWEQNPGW